jgi:glycosyltransferase involved in cell wall biosynthesis
MRILVVHNYYGDFVVGGESQVVENELKLLRQHGHEVKLYKRTNNEFSRANIAEKLAIFFTMGWSERSKLEMKKLLLEFKPNIMHVHNFKFILTPSIFAAAKELGIKTVLTLHNYRLAVPCGNFMNSHCRVCEKCLNKSALSILIKRCSGDFIKSYMQYRVFRAIKNRKMLRDVVDCYIALSQFAKKKFITAGVPEDKIVVKFNFMNDIAAKTELPSADKRNGAIFIGRASVEKGLLFLIKAWQNINYPLIVIGDGPFLQAAQQLATDNSQIIFLGSLSHDICLQYLMKSRFMVFPSTLYEGMPMTIMESFACGTPVIASDLGPRSELITNGKNGFLYEYDAENQLIQAINKMIAVDDDKFSEISGNARDFYQARCTPEMNYKKLITIYHN